MPAAARCSECSAALVDEEGRPKPSGTKTCSTKCRSKRQRRIKAQRIRTGSKSPHDPAVQDLAAATRGEVKDAAHDIMVEELRPIVREALTADVLASIDTLVGLTPRAIEVLKGHLESSDETIAQRAYTLLLRYTMGNPSIAPPPTEKAAAPMSVIFNIPRPGDTTPERGELPEPGDAEELRECLDCHEHKSSAEFVASSDRCLLCFEDLRGKVSDRFTPEPPA